jgi:dephospho-CoA kinase
MGNPDRAYPLVIGSAGYKGSGKTTVASGIAQHTDGIVASFGAYVRTKAPQDTDPIALADLGARLLASLGPELLVHETIAEAEWDGSRTLIIEGIRHVSVLEVLLRRFPQFRFVFIDAPSALRSQRLHDRDGLDRNAIAELQTHSTESGVEALRGRADLVVDGSIAKSDNLSRVVLHWLEM